MYTEFLIMYIGLGVLILLAIAILILLIVLVRRDSGSYIPRTGSMASQSTTQSFVPSGNIVFCKKCATEFDASQRCCPRCGTPR